MYRYGTKIPTVACSDEPFYWDDVNNPSKVFKRYWSGKARKQHRQEIKRQLDEYYDEQFNGFVYAFYNDCSQFCNCEYCYNEIDWI